MGVRQVEPPQIHFSPRIDGAQSGSTHGLVFYEIVHRKPVLGSDGVDKDIGIVEMDLAHGSTLKGKGRGGEHLAYSILDCRVIRNGVAFAKLAGRSARGGARGAVLRAPAVLKPQIGTLAKKGIWPLESGDRTLENEVMS